MILGSYDARVLYSGRIASVYKLLAEASLNLSKLDVVINALTK